MNKKYSKEIASVIKNFLDEDDLHFRFNEEQGFFRFGIHLNGKLRSVDYFVDVRDDEFNV